MITGDITLSKMTAFESRPLISFMTAPIGFKLQVIHQVLAVPV